MSRVYNKAYMVGHQLVRYNNIVMDKKVVKCSRINPNVWH